MSQQFEQDDIIWCPNQVSKFWPAKVKVDEESGEWKKDDQSQVFVQLFHAGKGRTPKGKWHNISDLVSFEASSIEPEFECEKLTKVYGLAKTAFESKNVKRRSTIKLERCSSVITPVAATTLATPAPKKRGRPPKSGSKVSKSTSKKNEARGVFAKLGKDLELTQRQLNVTVSDNEEDEGEEVDDDTKAKVDNEMKNFLDELDSDEDDKENNDSDWNPRADKENRRPSAHFVFKNARKPLAPLEPMPKDEKSEYEMIQEKRRAEQRQMLESMKLASFALMKTITPGVRHHKRFGGSAKGPAHRRRESAPVRYSTRARRPVTRSRLNSDGTSPSLSELGSPSKRPLFEEDMDHDDYVAAKRSKTVRAHPTRWIKNPNTDILSADDVTEAMLANVSDYVSEKIYNQAKGSSCHQCRQKTLDMKTICRSGKCHGVRGQFCGVCLRNRYGECVRTALKDPNWQCPPCRDICNCSICRNRQGKGATGILTQLALKKGHKSVKEYLESLVKKHGTDNFDDDED